MNEQKTKVMELLGNDHEIFAVKELVFVKVEQFKYLGTPFKHNNDWSTKILNRTQKTKNVYCILIKFFKPKLYSRRTKLRLRLIKIKTDTNVSMVERYGR